MPSAAPAKPWHRRAGLLLASLAVVAAGGLAAGLLAHNQGGQAEQAATSPSTTASRPASRATAGAIAKTPSPSSTPTPTPTPSGTATTAVPKGYHLVTDPKGFSLAVADGFTRSYVPPRVFYFSSGEVFRLGIRTAAPGPGGPLAAMTAQHTAGPGTYKGYRDGFVTEVTRKGNPAALWEFTWDGFGDGGGARRTYDLCWTEGGRQYDVWVSSPVAKAEQGREYFDTARDTFRPTP
jgi:hypothetical protein